MMKLTRRSAIAAMGATLATPAVLRAQSKVTLKLHHFLPAVAPFQKEFLEPWAQEISEASDGAIEIQMYPAMQLGGKPPQLIDQVRKGISDIAWTLPVYTPDRFPVAETMALPFMITSAEKTSVAMWKLMEEFGEGEYEGIHPLAFHTHAGGKLHSRGEGITEAAQLQGLKMRAPNQATGQLLEALGSEPVFFPVTDMVVGLSNGVIDGCCLPYEVVPAYNLQDLTSYSAEPAEGARGLYANSFTLAMNQGVYDGLPEELKTVMDEHSGLETSRRIGANFDQFEAVGRGIVEKAGNEIVIIPAEEVDRWREKAQPIHQAWADKLDAAGYDGQAVLARLNELLDAS